MLGDLLCVYVCVCANSRFRIEYQKQEIPDQNIIRTK